MEKSICEICKQSEAKKLLKLFDNNRSYVLQVCEEDYLNLKNAKKNIFPAPYSADPQTDNSNLEEDLDFPETSGNKQTDINDTLSEETKKVVQDSAKLAIELKHEEIKPEHMLYFLIDDAQIENILNELNIRTVDVKKYIETFAPRGNKSYQKSQEININFSDDLRTMFENAYETARESGSKLIEPIHLFICISEIKSLAKDILINFNPDSIEQASKFIANATMLAKHLKFITLSQLEKIKNSAKKNLNIDLYFETSVLEYLTEVELLPKLDIAEIQAKIKENIEYTLVQEIIKGNIKSKDVVIVYFDSNTHEMVFSKKSPDLSKT